ncbi:C40 family peptidase [Chryseobacterium sp. MP_3.2]|uniref:C40 family peptidase n=1 Tax=Chryseobacterium sp. MP_3.2 TaxID=3071712 RepID=UPI002E02C696|nr:cell wall-associated NlpC family hydrolase [Chryseobacterium sp. MP_3.2]
MDIGICTVSVAALRLEQSHQSEMTSQILFGEAVDILERERKFTKVNMHFDGYEGWVDSSQIKLISEEQFEQRKVQIVTNNFEVQKQEGKNILLSTGSEIDAENLPYFLNVDQIDIHAKEFLNVPYLWSGRSFFGVDCSGFIQLLYKIHGINLPREAPQQAEKGEVLSFVEECKAGDLAFFENEEGAITHVGMMISTHQIIHASGKVRIDFLDSSGIFNSELKKHTHKLRFIRSIF